MRQQSNPRLLFWTRFNVVFLLLLVVAESVVGELTSPTALLLYVPQHAFGLLTLALILGSLGESNRRILAFNLLVGVTFTYYFLGARAPLQASRSQGPTVRVMTWNIEKLKGTPEAIAREIRAQNPDVVCLQETVAGQSGDLTPDLLRLFAGWESRRARDVTTLSRFPLVESRDYLMPMPHRRKLLATTWKTPNGPLCVLNAHIATTAAGQSEPYQTSLWRRAISIARHARGTAVKRASQLPIIDRASSDATAPIVLVGDFNNPPRGRFHRHLSANFRDAFAQAGWGLGHSFPAKLPLLRIDYIWVGKELGTRRCFTPATRISDHLPVVADIAYGSS